MRRATLLPSAALLALLAARPAPAAAPPAAPGFVSAGRHVRVERFEPTGAAPLPAVVLLHGLDGLDGDAGAGYRLAARRLAQRGHVVFLVHYFDRTGTTRADTTRLLKRFRACLGSPAKCGAGWEDVRGTFDAWLAAVGDAVGYARRQPRVDPGRVALVGFSMGGFLATAAASRPDLNITCVVELFGGMPPYLLPQARRLAPALIVHGRRDDVVPLRHALALRDALTAQRVPHQVKLYDVGHGFTTPGGRFDWFAALDAEDTAAQFLKRHLANRRQTASKIVAMP